MSRLDNFSNTQENVVYCFIPPTAGLLAPCATCVWNYGIGRCLPNDLYIAPVPKIRQVIAEQLNHE